MELESLIAMLVTLSSSAQNDYLIKSLNPLAVSERHGMF